MAKVGSWLSRGLRDEEFKALKAAGRDVSRRTAKNVSLSCDYIEDCDGGHSAPNGYGGRAPTMHAAIYIIDENPY